MWTGRDGDEALAPELQERLADNDELAEAFYTLTPGRQREYNLHVSDAKQSETRHRRTDNAAGDVLLEFALAVLGQDQGPLTGPRSRWPEASCR